ncbi:MAG: GatB/YqeY domain-containing protein [Pyrinomonadaceae bacterium MAG19_C2-C3]|nr:GatB/YqeY domain-containing protein [Pyrinomonadaceae bacterium MAG19_C2-C3]
MNLKQRIVKNLTDAMKAKDAARTSTLRMVKAAFMNREIEKGSELSDDELTKMLQSLVKQRRDSIEQYDKAGRPELAAKERAEITVIDDYLPRAASTDDIERAVTEAISELGATTMKDMGTVMKAAQTKLAGLSADGRAVSEMVKKRLGS